MTQSGNESAANRMYDEDSGLGVEWVRSDPPMERQIHLQLLIGDRQIPFIAYYEYGIDRLMRENPRLSSADVLKLSSSSHSIIYTAFNIDAEFDRDQFVQIWHRLMTSKHPSFAVGVIYSEKDQSSPSNLKWSQFAEQQPAFR